MIKKTLPQEHSFHLNINNEKEISLICTKENLRELTIGFLYNEGLIAGLDQLQDLKIYENDTRANILLSGAKKDQTTEYLIRTTGLGGLALCDKSDLQPAILKEVYDFAYINKCKSIMSQYAVQYAKTGGIHCSAIFNSQTVLAVYEDIGRHNTLDKLAGCCLLKKIHAADTIMITTGRISLDMVKKTARMGCSVIVSYTTPTQQAYELAKELNISLIGYIGRESMQIYCGQKRISTVAVPDISATIKDKSKK